MFSLFFLSGFGNEALVFVDCGSYSIHKLSALNFRV